VRSTVRVGPGGGCADVKSEDAGAGAIDEGGRVGCDVRRTGVGAVSQAILGCLLQRESSTSDQD
jgi:hypothetical protein